MPQSDECLDQNRQPPPFARRKHERLPAVEDHIWVQWWDKQELLGQGAKLVNISRGGALIVASRPLPQGQLIQLFLEFSEPQLGMKAKVLEVLQGSLGVNQIRLAFEGECSEPFYLAAAYGFGYAKLRQKEEKGRANGAPSSLYSGSATHHLITSIIQVSHDPRVRPG